MRFFIWHGADDIYSEPKETMKSYHDLLKKLEIEETLKVATIEPGLGHEVSKEGLEALMAFIN